MTRRKLLCSASVFALAGCVSAPTDAALATLIAKVSDLVGGLSALPGWLKGLLSADRLSQISGLVMRVVALGRSIAAVASLAEALPLVGALPALLNEIFALLPAGVMSANVTRLLAAASTYLPIILALVGLVAAPRAARFGAMSEAEARSVLIAAMNN